MTEGRQGFMQGLSAHLFALEAVRPAVMRGETDAIASVERVARSLSETARQADYPDIAEAALIAARSASRPDSLDRVLAALRAVSNEGRGERIHLLVIDDDPVSSRFIDATLDSPNRQLHLCKTLAEADRILDRHDISLVLLDLALPDGDGRGLLVRLRHDPRYATLPIVVVTNSSGTQPRTECFALGADDFIGKPFDPRSLAACVAARLHRASDLARSGRTDALTGLPNQASLARSFERLRVESRGSRKPVCVGVVRCDRLQWTNDTFGIGAGDTVLRAVAGRLSELHRDRFPLGRWGGGMFTILMGDTARPVAARWLEQVLASVRGLTFAASDGRSFRSSFTAGVAEAPPDPGGEPDGIGGGQLLTWLVRMAEQHSESVDTRDSTRARRVLLAEDDATMSKLLGGLLRLDGFEVTHAVDGREALDLAPREAPGLVVLDVGLPVLDGFEVLRELRRMPGYDRLPIMMMSGDRDSRSVARGLELGADDYVVKPFSPVELRSRVRRLVTRH